MLDAQAVAAQTERGEVFAIRMARRKEAKQLRAISDATHNGTVGDCHAALREAGLTT
jgi:hypothetical protein